MKRHSCVRCLTLLGKTVIMPAALLALLTTGPNHILAAEKNSDSKSSQSDAAKKSREQAEDHIKSSRTELKKRNFATAREFLAKARAADAKAPGLDQLARDIAAAEQSANEARRDEQVDRHLDSAKSQLKSDKFDAALASVQDALSLDPSNKNAQKLRAKIEKEKVSALEDALEETVENRIDAAERAIKENNFDSARRMEAAARESAKGLFKDDLDELSEDIAKAESKYRASQNKREIDRLETSAKANLKANRYDQARQDVSKIFELDRQNKDAAKLLQKIGEDEKEFIAERAEREAELRVEQADRLLKADKYTEAATAYSAILKDMPDNKDARKGLNRANKEIASQAAKSADKESAKAKAEKEAAEKKKMADAKAKEDERKAAEMKKAEAEKAAAEQKRVAAEKKAEADRAAAEQKRLAAEEKKAEEKRMAEAKAAERKEVAPPPVKAPEPIEVADAKVETTVEKSVPNPFARDKQTQASTPAPTEAAPTPIAPDPFARESTTPAPTPAAKNAKADEKAEEKKAEEASKQEAAAQQERRKRAENAYREGVELYEKGELARARQRWLDAKELDSTYLKPDSYLQNTEAEYNTLLANQASAKEFEQREAAALEKMDTLIPFRTLEPTPLSEFLQGLRLLSGINFVIAGEVNAKVEAAFEDQPLHEVLDSTLLPIGLRWRRDPGSDTVIIEPDLRTEVFHVTPDQIVVAQSLIEEGTIGRLLYGPSGQPILQGQEVFSDPRRNIIVVTDSAQNLNKMRRLLESLESQQRTQLIFDSYEIDETRASEIKALLDAILAADDDQPYNTQRKLILEGSTLIVKDTPQNVQKVREILQDQNFLKRFYEDKLSVQTFNLTPIIDFEDNPDLVRQFTDQVRQVVETLLYAQEGRSKAEREGRRLWFDPATLQLTITDYPDRIATVQNYIESLPYIRTRRRSKIIFLDHATAGELVSQIEAFLGISGATTSSTDTGTEVTKSLSVQDELEFQGGFFRVTRVNENDASDENDDSVELVVRTGTTSQDTTIEEFRSEFVEDYEIVAEDIKPSNTPGEGRARLTIRYAPNSNTGGNQQQDGTNATEEQQTQEADRERVTEETGLSIVEIENLNAIFVEYDNVEELREVEFWVRTLDIPTLQVDIEMKFVEVITNKAKELKPDFVIGDLTESLTLSDSVLRTRFAQDRDEFNSPFEPGLESNDSANLLKGATVFNFLVGSGNSPISFQLKVLEAQGIINIVNGPRVTVLNAETVDFRIEREFGLAAPIAGATSGSGSNANFSLVASLVPVDLSITPTVTRAGNIRLDLDVDIRDFDQNLGQLTNLDGDSVSPLLPDATLPVARISTDIGILRKELTTQARIKDGGTIVLGGWRNERASDLESGIPILRDIPFIGPFLFERMQKDQDKITLLIFLTGNVVRD